MVIAGIIWAFWERSSSALWIKMALGFGGLRLRKNLKLRRLLRLADRRQGVDDYWKLLQLLTQLEVKPKQDLDMRAVLIGFRSRGLLNRETEKTAELGFLSKPSLRGFRPDLLLSPFREKVSLFSGFRSTYDPARGAEPNLQNVFRLSTSTVVPESWGELPVWNGEYEALIIEAVSHGHFKNHSHPMSLYECFFDNPPVVLDVLEICGAMDIAASLHAAVQSMGADYLKTIEIIKLELIAQAGTVRPEVMHQSWSSWKFLKKRKLEITLTSNSEEQLSEHHKLFALTKTLGGFHRAKNVTIFKTIMFKGEEFYDLDPSMFPHGKAVACMQGYFAGTHLNLNYLAISTPPGLNSNITLKKAIVLTNRCDQNWFHWIIETLPRLMILDGMFEDYPVIVSDDLPPQAIQALMLITVREILPVSRDSLLEIEDALYPGHVIYLPDLKNIRESSSAFEYSERALLDFRNKVRLTLTNSGGTKKLFIVRSGTTRTIFGLKLVSIAFRFFGFATLDLSKLSFASQLSKIQESDQIVLMGGAGMANLLFCSPGARVAVLYPKSAEGYLVQNKLCDLAGAVSQNFWCGSLAFMYPRAGRTSAAYLVGPMRILRILKFLKQSSSQNLPMR